MSILFDCWLWWLNNTTFRTWFPLLFYVGTEKLRHSLGRPSRSDLVQFLFVGLYVHRFSHYRNRLPTARLCLRISEQPFAQGRLSTSSAISPLVLATCWFSCLAAPPIDCFSNKLAPCAQTVFSKQSLCSPSLRKSAKGLPAQAEKSALWLWKVINLCKLAVLLCRQCLLLKGVSDRRTYAISWILACMSRDITCWTITFFQNMHHLRKCRSFPHDHACPGGIPPHRHLEKFSQIFRA